MPSWSRSSQRCWCAKLAHSDTAAHRQAFSTQYQGFPPEAFLLQGLGAMVDRDHSELVPELDRHPVELAVVIARAMELANVEQRGHRVFVSVPRGLRCELDSERAAQAVANLLDNAAKFSNASSIIMIEAIAADRALQISVRAQGFKISPDVDVLDPAHLDRDLFPDLAIARRLVGLHGGRVEVSREEHLGGSALVAVFPQPDTKPSTVVEPRAKSVPNGKRILIVDDNDDAARSLRTAVELFGYTVEIAHNGPVALQAAKSFKPDVALLDIGLPVMDGHELSRRLRVLREATPHLKFVAITGFGQDTYRQRSLELGFAEHLLKPVELDTLERVIGELTRQT